MRDVRILASVSASAALSSVVLSATASHKEEAVEGVTDAREKVQAALRGVVDDVADWYSSGDHERFHGAKRMADRVEDALVKAVEAEWHSCNANSYMYKRFSSQEDDTELATCRECERSPNRHRSDCEVLAFENAWHSLRAALRALNITL